ncbi:serine hydrolase [Luteimonas marina]|uniref:Serine hydrolase n=1 Tax=Luteimonas marina TaxID=488485 RepID=A0A5C5U9W3_9GAMM|nr:serine hydrolase [Luteimonas marina]TWT22352.1 serine hydrolase [Luteimonas marina]
MRLSATLALLLLSPFVPDAAAAPSKTEVAAFAKRAVEGNCVADAPGMAVLLARGDEVLYRGACGRASLELDVPLSPDHVFRIGSVTKQFAAAAALKLAEDGRLSLDDPLSKFVPGYPGGDKVTVRMLLNHTSGIRSYTDIGEIMSGTGIMKDLSTAQLIDSFKDQKPDFAPGEGWHYNNSGYVLLGAVIEAASGKSWHAYLDEALFKPLGMAHTGYGNAAEAVIPGHAAGYTRSGDRWAQARYLSMTQPHAAGALVSTVDDLLKWNRALHEGKVLREASHRAMVTPVGKAAEHDYGFGITAGTLRGQPVRQHGGGIFGFSAYLLYLPDEEVSVAVLYNADSGRPGMLGTGRIANVLAAQAIGRPYPDKGKAIEVDEATLKQYEGVYRIDADAVRVLRVAGGRLTSQRSGGAVQALIPVAKDVFLFDEGFSRIVFERDGDGKIAAMRFFPEDEGEGEVVPRTDEAMPPARAEVTLPREALERLVGAYVHQGMTLTVSLDGEGPKAQLAGQPAFAIFAESPSRFFFKVVEATLEFAPADGVPATVTLRQGGAVMVFERRD